MGNVAEGETNSAWKEVGITFPEEVTFKLVFLKRVRFNLIKKIPGGEEEVKRGAFQSKSRSEGTRK